MKNLLLFSTIGMVLLSITFLGFKASPTAEINSFEIKWYTLEEALAAQEKNKKIRRRDCRSTSARPSFNDFR